MEIPEELQRNLLNLVWGDNIDEAIFERWSQGFQWSADERCALTQHHGGPCAVIVPVQAYFMKNLFFNPPSSDDELPGVIQCDYKNLQESDRKEVFLQTLREMFDKCSCTEDSRERVTSYFVTVEDNQRQAESSGSVDHCEFDNQSQFSKHSRLRYIACSSQEEMKSVLAANYDKLMKQYGVLSFLYSIILTRGLENIRKEMDNEDTCLIDSVHGLGSQGLINLMICGEAVSNVWDGVKQVSGLALRGISCQCDVGFLTLLEKYRYCSVGNLLKRPKYPIWLIGSENHLTLLFTLETALVAKESQYEVAMKVFQEYDPEDNGFIAAILLGDVMCRLELVSEPEYVKIVQEKLDPEDLGIILQSKFLEEFYAHEDKKSTPDSFIVYHYNGLAQSARDSKVQFNEGAAVIVDWQENSGRTSDTVIESCLQIRWPGIQISWKDEKIPSLN